MKKVFSCFVVIVLFAIFSERLDAKSKEGTDIKFSKGDLIVLKEIRKVKGLSGGGAKLLLSAPVIEMLNSSPVDLIVTLYGTDFERMLSGAKAMEKIGRCQIEKILQTHLTIGYDDYDPPVGGARAYFERLAKATQC